MRVFISYRRGDNPYLAESIHTALSAAFGREQVFFDVASIPGGEEFERRIRAQIAWADVVVAVIGRSWSKGRRSRDWVSDELMLADRMGRLVVPVWEDLVGAVPEYPEHLDWLSARHGYTIHAGRSRQDLDDLSAAIERAYLDHLTRSGLRSEVSQEYITAEHADINAEGPTSGPTSSPVSGAPVVAFGLGMHGRYDYTPWLAGVAAELVDLARGSSRSAIYDQLQRAAGVDTIVLDTVWGTGAGGLLAALCAAAVAADVPGASLADEIVRLADVGQLLGSPSGRTDTSLWRSMDFLSPALRECIETWFQAAGKIRQRCDVVVTSSARATDPADRTLTPVLAHVAVLPEGDADRAAHDLTTCALVGSASSPLAFGEFDAVQEHHQGVIDLVSAPIGPPPAVPLQRVIVGKGERWEAATAFVADLASRTTFDRPTERRFLIADPRGQRTVRAPERLSNARVEEPPPDMALLTTGFQDQLARERQRQAALAHLSGCVAPDLAAALAQPDANRTVLRRIQLADSTASWLTNYLANGGTATPPIPLMRHAPIALSSVMRQRLRAEVRAAHENDPSAWERGPVSFWQHAVEVDRWLEGLAVATRVDGPLLIPRAKVQTLLRIGATLAEAQQLVVWRAAADAGRSAWIRSALGAAASITRASPRQHRDLVQFVQAISGSAQAQSTAELDVALTALAEELIADAPLPPSAEWSLMDELWPILHGELLQVTAWLAEERANDNGTIRPEAWPARALEHLALDVAGADAVEVLNGIVATVGAGLSMPGQSQFLGAPLEISPVRTSCRVELDSDDQRDDLGGLIGPRFGGVGAVLAQRWRAHDVAVGRLDAAETIVRFLHERSQLAGKGVVPVVEGFIEARHREIMADHFGDEVDRQQYRVAEEGLRDLPSGRRQAVALRLMSETTRVVLADRQPRSWWAAVTTRVAQVLAAIPVFVLAAPGLTLLAWAFLLGGWVLGANDSWRDDGHGQLGSLMWTAHLPVTHDVSLSRLYAVALLIALAVIPVIVAVVRSDRRWDLTRTSLPIVAVSSVALLANFLVHLRIGIIPLSLDAAVIALLFTAWATGWRRWVPPAIAFTVHIVTLTLARSHGAPGRARFATASPWLVLSQAITILIIAMLTVFVDFIPTAREPVAGDAR